MDWLKAQIEWIKSFFNEPNGKASSKRLVSVAVVAVFLIAYLRVGIALIKNGQPDIPDIPMNWSFMIAGIIGLGIIDKSITKKGEAPK